MAVIAPFRGITYNIHSGLDLSRLVTPPYDVISEEEQDEFYRADPHNIIRLILGKSPPVPCGWYASNAHTMAGLPSGVRGIWLWARMDAQSSPSAPLLKLS